MKDTTNIKDYLIEKNKNQTTDIIDAFKDPIEDATDILIKSFKPDISVKNLGMVNNSPILSLIDDKIGNINEILKIQLLGQNQDKKNNFLIEAQQEKEFNIQEKNSEYLKKISDNVLDSDSDSEGGDKKAGILKTILGSFMGGGAGVAGILGLGKVGDIAKKASSGLKKFGKIAVKGLGKVALPIALLMGAVDFKKGFENVLEITGRDDFSAKLQAGLSTAISGLTFGLLDPKTISQSLDNFQNYIFELILNPIDSFKKIFGENFNFIDIIDKALDTITFGLIPEGMFKEGYEKFKNYIINLFITPINMIKEYVQKGFNFLDTMDDIFKKFTFNLIDGIGEGIDSFKNFIIKIFTDPFEAIKIYAKQCLNFINIINDVLSFLSFGLIPEGVLQEGILKISEMIKNFIISPFIKIKDFVSEKITNSINFVKDLFNVDVGVFDSVFKWFDDFNLVDFMGIGTLLEKIKAFKENISNILGSPKKFLKSLFNKSDDEKIKNNDLKRENLSSDKSNKFKKSPDKEIDNERNKFKKILSKEIDIKNAYFRNKNMKRKEEKTENNTQNIINNSNQNLIIQDDMGTQIDDREFLAYAY